MGVVAWLVIGGVAGLVCDLLLDGRFPGGRAGATLGGTAGAFLGGALLAILSGDPAGRPGVVAAAAALVGASLMLTLVKMADVAGDRPARRLLSEGDVLQAHRQRDGRPDARTRNAARSPHR